MSAPVDGRFPTTEWTLISRLQSGDEAVSRHALDELCARYHYPLYYYIRRRGLEHHDAQDALQDFLVKMLRIEAFKEVHAEAGRLRGFLGTSLQRFLLTWFRSHARERHQQSVEAAREMAAAEGRFLREPLRDDDTPERIFERKWAGELLLHVQRQLQAQYREKNKAALYATLRPALLAGGSLRGEDTPGLAASLGMSEGSLRVAMSRLLDDYRKLLRAEVIQTVADPRDVEDEIAHLISVFGKA